MPAPDPQAKPPLPVTILSGYLGAGKTTLLNAILAGDHRLRIAVLVNDFGKIAIDEALIVSRGGDVAALANGCMCCQIGGDLYDAIDRVLGMRERFDHLVIETSGVADPAKVGQIAVAEPDLELALTAVLVDAVNFADILADPRLNDTLLRQVRAAGLILVTKAGATAAALADIRSMLADAGASAAVDVLEKGDRDAWRLLEQGRGEAAARQAGPLRLHALPFASWSWEGPERIDRDSLLAFARDPALKAYRMKGRLHLAEGGSVVLHKVGAEIAIEKASGDFARSELVAIGAKPDFDPARVAAAWTRLIGAAARR